MKAFWILALLLVSIGCSSSDEASAEKDSLIEEYPKVNLKNYKTVQFEEDFELLILKELTESKSQSDNAILGFSHLSKEKHVFIEKESISTYTKSLYARSKSKKDLLKSFADESLKDFKGVLKSSSESKFIKSKVGEMICLRTEFNADSYGFPRNKTYSYRVFQGKDYFYTLVCWTITDSYKEFKQEAKAMTLSFKEL